MFRICKPTNLILIVLIGVTGFMIIFGGKKSSSPKCVSNFMGQRYCFDTKGPRSRNGKTNTKKSKKKKKPKKM